MMADRSRFVSTGKKKEIIKQEGADFAARHK
jgi:hypothetical protein